MSAAELPSVTAADVVVDSQWFHDHPGRRYRIRRAQSGGHWIVRRRGRNTFLRVWAPRLVNHELVDADPALRIVWFRRALPDLNPLERAELVKHVKRGERLHDL